MEGEVEDGEVEMGEEERMRYSEQFQAENQASMYEAGEIQGDAGEIQGNVGAYAAPPVKRGRKRGRRNKNKSRKAPRPDEDDEDGDFGGMFDDNVRGFPFEDGTSQPDDVPGQIEAFGGYGEDDNDDDDGPVQKPAFMVEGEPNFELAEPDDGFEFIRRVRWEAKAYPNIHIAKTAPPKEMEQEQTSYVPVIPGIPACDSEIMPSKEWEETFIRMFSELRDGLQFEEQAPGSFPHMRDEAGWKSLCFGSNGGSEDAYRGEDVDLQDVSGLLQLSPFFTTVVKLDEVHRANLLRQHISWLSEVEKLPRFRGMWLLALAAAVDKPVDAETSCALRSLLRTCAAFRASRVFHEDFDLQLLNRIIAVSGIYFGQDDTNRF